MNKIKDQIEQAFIDSSKYKLYFTGKYLKASKSIFIVFIIMILVLLVKQYFEILFLAVYVYLLMSVYTLWRIETVAINKYIKPNEKQCISEYLWKRPYISATDLRKKNLNNEINRIAQQEKLSEYELDILIEEFSIKKTFEWQGILITLFFSFFGLLLVEVFKMIIDDPTKINGDAFYVYLGFGILLIVLYSMTLFAILIICNITVESSKYKNNLINPALISAKFNILKNKNKDK